MCVKAETLFGLEDKIMRHPGLYLMWTVLFVINLIVLGVDDTTGPARDFNVISSLFSTLYVGASAVNQVYGNGLPSTMLLTIGPVHQYSTWILLGYYRGDVYGTNELGVMNAVYTVVVGLFTVDMVMKSWITTVYPDYYLDYAEKKEGENVGKGRRRAKRNEEIGQVVEARRTRNREANRRDEEIGQN